MGRKSVKQRKSTDERVKNIMSRLEIRHSKETVNLFEGYCQKCELMRVTDKTEMLE